LDFAQALSSFSKIVEQEPTPNAYSALQNMKQDEGCSLQYAADLSVMLTKGLSPEMGVHQRLGTVKSASIGTVRISFIPTELEDKY
jgi:hypothetical protein